MQTSTLRLKFFNRFCIASLACLTLLATPSYAIGPTAVTANPTNLTGDAATLNGITNPGGSQTTARFRYGTSVTACSSDTTTAVADQSPVAAGTTDVNLTATITGLTRGTTYYYCLLTSNAFGSALGSAISFVSPNTPIVTTNPPTSLTATTVILSGSANPRGLATTGWFRYSATNPVTCNDSFGVRAPASGSSALGSGTTALAYSQNVSGLTSLATYYVCAIAQNTAGTSVGTVLTITTPYAVLDIDQSGSVNSNTDGLLVVRYLLGLRGDALTAGALGTNAQRKDAQAIEAYIRSLMQ